MSLTALSATYRTPDGDLRVASIGVAGHDHAELIRRLAELGDPVDLGPVIENPDSNDPVRSCGHGSAEYTRMLPERPNPAVTELERMVGL